VILADILNFAGCDPQLQVDLEWERDIQKQESFRSLDILTTNYTRLHTTLRLSLAVMSLYVSMNLRLAEVDSVNTVCQYRELPWKKIEILYDNAAISCQSYCHWPPFLEKPLNLVLAQVSSRDSSWS